MARQVAGKRTTFTHEVTLTKYATGGSKLGSFGVIMHGTNNGTNLVEISAKFVTAKVFACTRANDRQLVLCDSFWPSLGTDNTQLTRVGIFLCLFYANDLG